MVVEMLQALRQQHPVPATAIQFTGGSPRYTRIFRIVQSQQNGLFACPDRDERPQNGRT